MSTASEASRSTLTRRAGLVAVGTMASRLLGAIRDAVVAASFSVSATDAFFVAFTIPNAFRVLLGEGAVSAAFVPLFSEAREKEGPEATKRVFASLSGAMSLILLGVTILGIVGAPWFVTLYAPGYLRDPEKFDLTVKLTRAAFPYLAFMGLAAVSIGGLYSAKRFLVPAFAPALLNVALIAAPFTLVVPAMWLGMPPVGSLALGAVLGGVLQIVLQYHAVHRIAQLDWPRIHLQDPYVKKCFQLLAPLLIGLGVYQTNIMFSRLFASFLPDGSQSYLYYGSRIVEIPQGVFGLAIASATLPTLAELQIKNQPDEVKRVFRHGLRLCFFSAIPCTFLIVVLAREITTVLFGRGSFSEHHILETAQSLIWQAVGVWAVAAVRVVVPMFHAKNDTKAPIWGSAINVIVFIAMSLLLMTRFRHVGLAIAISAAAIMQLVALLWMLRGRVGSLGLMGLKAPILKITVASIAMTGVAWLMSTLGHWSQGGNDPRNIIALIAALVCGGATYILVARALHLSEAIELTDWFKRALRSKRT